MRSGSSTSERPSRYTDTSESWKLTDSRKRLAIAGAGIAAELALAAVASLLWSLAPDGAFRTAMFFLATTSWVLTLAVNASPFMRFDGYFILCDLIDFPNLHERAGRFARVGLRRWIAGFADPWPEALTAARRRALIAFALATWLYRVLVFLGIALLVYAYCFKLLGIALMLLEIGWFIGRPVQAELRVWWSRRAEVRAGRRRLGLALIALSLALLLVPWQSGVHGDGYLRSARQQQVFAPRAGQIVAMPARREVQQGELIFALNAPDLRTGADRARAMAEARATELIGLGGQKDGEERRAILQSERDRLLAEASVFTGEQSRLKLTAAFPGVLTDVDELLKAGVWVGPDLPLATLFDPTSWVADIYVAESQVERVRAGDEARIYCGPEAFTGRVVQVDSSRATTLAHPMLAVTSGGPIATIPRATRDGREPLVRDGLYRVRIELAEVPQRPRMALCAAVIDAKRRAMLHGVFDQALSVLIRESGF